MMQQYDLNKSHHQVALKNGLLLKSWIEVDSKSLQQDLHIEILTAGNQKLATLILNDFNEESEEIAVAVEAAIALRNERKPKG